MGDLIKLLYLVAIVLFIFGIKRLSKVKTARSGNMMAAISMLIAVVAALASFQEHVIDWRWIVAGAIVGALIGGMAASMVEMTAMPEMVALFNGSGGAASFLVGLAALFGWAGSSHAGADALLTSAILQPDVLAQVADPNFATRFPDASGAGTAIALMLSLLVGGITLSGSLVAYCKLSGRIIGGNAINFPGQHALNLLLIVGALGLGGYTSFVAEGGSNLQWLGVGVTGLALLLGVLLVIPIGGADMPVVISLLNSYSGIAASMTGFVLKNELLIISGAMVGAAGLILTAIMCKAMNRSLLNVLMGGFGGESAGVDPSKAREYDNITSIGSDELAMMLDGVSSVIFVPGYGLAVAQAQHVVRELADSLEERGVEVKYAIHPVAGRMPGHMNVLLAESNVPYEALIEMDHINPEFKTTDIVIVTGANDVVNPAALDEPESPLAGMPILLTHEAQNVVVIKRSLSPGYAGVKNKLFDYDNCYMLFGDAKAVLQETLDELKES
jgi:NAD(P) transhydrogenase subunit beta